jgi:hypothetical protein
MGILLSTTYVEHVLVGTALHTVLQSTWIVLRVGEASGTTTCPLVAMAGSYSTQYVGWYAREVSMPIMVCGIHAGMRTAH